MVSCSQEYYPHVHLIFCFLLMVISSGSALALCVNIQRPLSNCLVVPQCLDLTFQDQCGANQFSDLTFEDQFSAN